MPQINRPGRPPVDNRRVTLSLTDEEIDHIAEKAAEQAVAKMTAAFYREVGRGVVNRFLWIIGILAIAAYVAAQQRGWIK